MSCGLRKAALASAIVMLSASVVSAECDINGNCYNVTPNHNGGYKVDGYSLNNGSTWSSTIDQRGQRGWDANSDYYTYDRDSGTYYNYGTGTMCTGKGASRMCF